MINTSWGHQHCYSPLLLLSLLIEVYQIFCVKKTLWKRLNYGLHYQQRWLKVRLCSDSHLLYRCLQSSDEQDMKNGLLIMVGTVLWVVTRDAVSVSMSQSPVDMPLSHLGLVSSKLLHASISSRSRTSMSCSCLGLGKKCLHVLVLSI